VIAGLTVIEAAASANSGAEYLPRWRGHCAPDATNRTQLTGMSSCPAGVLQWSTDHEGGGSNLFGRVFRAQSLRAAIGGYTGFVVDVTLRSQRPSAHPARSPASMT
jgi:hypothetical protein